MPKVKKLEWGNPHKFSSIDSHTITAALPEGYTIIPEVAGKFKAEITWDDGNGCFESLGIFDSTEEAQEACQKHWESQVLNWLEQE